MAHDPSGSGAPGNVISAAQTAVSRWNSEVLALDGYTDSLPHFNPTVEGGTSAPGTIVDLLYTDECTSEDCGYCGSFVPGSVRGIDLKRRKLGDPCGGLGRVVDDLTGVIMHELSHVLGFSHTSGPGTEWCVTNVQEEGDLNPHLCRWEIQSVYKAYDLRNSDPAPTDTIASRTVILPNPHTVLTGSSDTIQGVGLVDPEPSQNVAAGGGPGLPSAVGPPDTIFVDVDWDDANSSFFSVTDLGDGEAEVDGVQIGEGPLAAEADDQVNAARRFAPRDSEKLLQTSRQTGVDLTTEGDDVQFFASTPESTGTERWTLLMARGDDQQAVLTRLKELIGN